VKFIFNENKKKLEILIRCPGLQDEMVNTTSHATVPLKKRECGGPNKFIFTLQKDKLPNGRVIGK
jgi:hypothetical protein